MTLVNRREFLKRLGAGSAIAVLPGYVSLGRVSVALGSPLPADLADAGLSLARKAGAEYADIRICSYVYQWIHLRDRKIHEMEDTSDKGFSVRVLVNGAWGFAASNVMTEEKMTTVVGRAVQLGRQAARLQVEPAKLVQVPSYQDTFETSYVEDPMEVPTAEKVNLLYTLCDRLLAYKGIVSAESMLYIAREDKHFFSTVGSRIKQRIVRAWCEYKATASSEDDHESRKFTAPPRTAGYEHIRQAGLLENVERIASEAVEKVNAEACPSNVKRDLVILPSNLWLTIHESVGHPTELDRVLGWEANYAGTSFATLDKLGSLKYGAPHVNFKADRTRPGGMSTCGYDDEGVKTTQWFIVKDGILVDYQTNRETASLGSDSGRPDSRHEEWNTHRWRRLVQYRPAATQLPVRRRCLLGDKEREENKNAQEGHLSILYHRLLELGRRYL